MLATSLKDIRGQTLDVRPIEVLLERMVSEFRPIEVRLFGSRARGDASSASDWDLFVVVPDDLAAADDIEHLSQYATAYRYPVSSSKTKRIPRPPSASELRQAIDDTATALDRAVGWFAVDLQQADSPARNAGPLRQ